MKNLIEPKKLMELRNKPVTYETVENFLKEAPEISAGFICKTIGLPPSNYYSWKARKRRSQMAKESKSKGPLSDVTPTGVGKRRYSSEDKVILLRDYHRLDEAKRGEFLRSYGLYHSDIERWTKVADQAAVEALKQKKQGRRAKSQEQLKIEELELEVSSQEKVITKLSALVVFQKKVSTILEK